MLKLATNKLFEFERYLHDYMKNDLNGSLVFIKIQCQKLWKKGKVLKASLKIRTLLEKINFELNH